MSIQLKPNPSISNVTPMPLRPVSQGSVKEHQWLKQLSASKLTLFLVLAGLVIVLGFFSVGAFWGHIDQQGLSYPKLLKIGVFCVEGSILFFVFMSIFHPRASVRLFSIGMSLFLAALAIAHNGAMLQFDRALKQSDATVSRLADEFKKLNESGIAQINSDASKQAEALRQRKAWASSRNAVAGAQQKSAQIVDTSQKNLVDASAKTKEQAEGSSIMPAWYWRGPCYFVLFLSTILGLVILKIVIERAEGYPDANNNGIPDNVESGSVVYDPGAAEKWWHSRGYLAPHETEQNNFPKP